MKRGCAEDEKGKEGEDEWKGGCAEDEKGKEGEDEWKRGSSVDKKEKRESRGLKRAEGEGKWECKGRKETRVNSEDTVERTEIVQRRKQESMESENHRW